MRAPQSPEREAPLPQEGLGAREALWASWGLGCTSVQGLGVREGSSVRQAGYVRLELVSNPVDSR